MTSAYEEMLAFLLAQLTAPVGQQVDEAGTVVITSGEPGEVIVRLTDSVVTVAEYALTWKSDTAAAVEPAPTGSVMWSVISSEAAMRVVKALIAAAREARLSKFATCRLCERSTPPEWMEWDDVCQECAECDPRTVH